MGMPITVEIADAHVDQSAFDRVYHYFEYVDEKFSTYKATSEITMINEQRLAVEQASDDMKLVFALAEQTRQETDGYFDTTRQDGTIDPSGIVKGWSIYNAAVILRQLGYENFYVDAGGDVQAHGKNAQGEDWRVKWCRAARFVRFVKAVSIHDQGMATSGTYIRGLHIYDPKHAHREVTDIVSLTVIGPNIYETDRFATAAFAMGRDAILFIERLRDFEGYMIDQTGQATLTSGFERYVLHDSNR